MKPPAFLVTRWRKGDPSEFSHLDSWEARATATGTDTSTTTNPGASHLAPCAIETLCLLLAVLAPGVHPEGGLLHTQARGSERGRGDCNR